MPSSPPMKPGFTCRMNLMASYGRWWQGLSRRVRNRLRILAPAALTAALGVWPPAAAGAQAQPLPNSMAQRVISCTACHGKDGRAASDGFYPRIAGKPAGYLYNQLTNFRAGRRRYPLMTYMTDHLSDAYLHEMAEYFSALQLPYPLPQAATVGPEVLERGRQLVQSGAAAKKVPACVACHGKGLTGMLPSIPGLLGLPRDYLNAQFGAWKSGARHAAAPDCMRQIVARLSDDDMSAAAAWLAAQPLSAVTAPAPATMNALPLQCGSFPQQESRR